MIAWMVAEVVNAYRSLEEIFVSGAIAKRRAKPGLRDDAQIGAEQPIWDPDLTPFPGTIPGWMKPPSSGPTGPPLAAEVVAALLVLGLATPPPRQLLGRLIRSALKESHPDRHPAAQQREMAARLQEVQSAREVLRKHGFA
jgi:hypothetical protein